MSLPIPKASDFFTGVHDVRISEYESNWDQFIVDFKTLSANGVPLSEFLSYFDEHVGAYRGVMDPTLVAKLANFDLGKYRTAPPPFRLGVENGKYALIQKARTGWAQLFPAIERILASDVDCLVELGAGLGTNLARVRLRYPGRDLAYIACEPTENGRKAAEMMYASEPGLRAGVRTFDYAAADFDFLKGFKRPAVFTCHSIEQETLVGEEFYRRLLDSNVVACAHLEPVGWQRFTNVFDIVCAMLRDPGVFQAAQKDYRWVIDDSHLSENAAMWSARHFYNVDLLRIVSAAAERGEIALFALDYDVAAHNPLNPSTVIAWVRRR